MARGENEVCIAIKNNDVGIQDNRHALEHSSAVILSSSFLLERRQKMQCYLGSHRSPPSLLQDFPMSREGNEF